MLEFRADGAPARRSHQNPDGSEWTVAYEYNDAGRLVIARSENGTGLVDLQLYEYDTAGRLVRVLARIQSGDDRIAEEYEYYATGGKKKVLYVDQVAQRPGTHYAWGVEGTDRAYSAPGAARLTTLYNECDQPTDLLFHDKTGRQLSRVEFRYDGDGHLVEEAQTNTEEVLPPEMLASLNQAQFETVRALFGASGEPIRCTHRYDREGRRTETRSQFGQLGSDIKRMVYNDYEDQIQEIWEHEERDYGIDDDGRLSDTPTREKVSQSEARFRYDYDPHGNWVVKIVESRAGTRQDFNLSSVERRTITYLA
jgi:YD repeat-containing protein